MTEQELAECYDVTPKVYCRDCEHFRRSERVRRGQIVTGKCCHPHAVYVTDCWKGPVTRRRGPEERNARNDCADFTPIHRRRRALRLVMLLVILGAFLGWSLWHDPAFWRWIH
jgi:hypothetical protein